MFCQSKSLKNSLGKLKVVKILRGSLNNILERDRKAAFFQQVFLLNIISFQLVNNLLRPSKNVLEVDKRVYERVLDMNWNEENYVLNFKLKFHKISVDILSGKKVPTEKIWNWPRPSNRVTILLQNIWRAGIGWEVSISNMCKLF